MQLQKSFAKIELQKGGAVLAIKKGGLCSAALQKKSETWHELKFWAQRERIRRVYEAAQCLRVKQLGDAIWVEVS